MIIVALTRASGWVWATSLQASVLIALVLLAQLLLGRFLTARWRYGLWLLVLVRLMIPGGPSSPFSIFNLTRNVGSLSAPGTERDTSALVPLPETRPVPAAVRLEPTAAKGFMPLEWRPAVAWLWAAGCLGGLLLVLVQHEMMARRVRRGRVEAVGLELLRKCRSEMGVSREVRMVSVTWLKTPALFGYWRPRLLLPEGMLARLTGQELRMVFLHELSHVKRRDILVNWVILLARSVHWFNPLVWAAMRRLRGERELVCDAMVMAGLGPEERRHYGTTLIRLADQVSGDGFCPSLAPVVQGRSEIKRRIIMIANYKPAGRAALLISALAMVLLCGLTFTRAAQKKEKPSVAPPAGGDAEARSPEARGMEALRKELDQSNEELRRAQERVTKLRAELGVPEWMEASGDPGGAGGMDRGGLEAMRRYEAERMNAEAELRRLEWMWKSLSAIDPNELQNVMDIAVPDELLTTLLKARAEGERRLASMGQKFGPETPDARAAREEQNKVGEQIERRIHGMLAGMRLKIDATRAQIELLQVEMDKARDREAKRAQAMWPYFDARRELDERRKVRDAILLRMLQEQMDSAVSGSERR